MGVAITLFLIKSIAIFIFLFIYVNLRWVSRHALQDLEPFTFDLVSKPVPTAVSGPIIGTHTHLFSSLPGKVDPARTLRRTLRRTARVALLLRRISASYRVRGLQRE